jgi:hypothetical protein
MRESILTRRWGRVNNLLADHREPTKAGRGDLPFPVPAHNDFARPTDSMAGET